MVWWWLPVESTCSPCAVLVQSLHSPYLVPMESLWSHSSNLDIPESFDPYVQLDANNAFKPHKSTILQLYSDPLMTLDSKDHLKRMQGYNRYNEPTEGLSEPSGVTGHNGSEPQVSMENPVTLLVCSKNRVWLGVVRLSKSNVMAWQFRIFLHNSFQSPT